MTEIEKTRDNLLNVIKRNAKHPDCAMYILEAADKYIRAAASSNTVAHVDNIVESEEKVCTCGVPNHLHGTCCGWSNASITVWPWEHSLPALISAEEAELRWLVSKSPNAERLARFLTDRNVITIKNSYGQ